MTAAQGAGLSGEDVLAVIQEAVEAGWEDEPSEAEMELARIAARNVAAALDPIVARRERAAVAAALTTAAEAIEADAAKWEPVIPIPEGWDLGYIHRRQGQCAGREAAARIVRDLIPQEES